MSDDDRTSRPRVGDETKERIENLASGWSVKPDAAPDPKPGPAPPAATPDATPGARKKPKTLPPPPPGSVERKQLEEAIVESKGDTPKPEAIAAPPKVVPPRPNVPTAPPPVPPRGKPASVPPPIPSERPPETAPDNPAIARPPSVPVGEFGGGGVTTVDEDKLRIQYAQSTIKRDAAEALLQIAGSPQTVVKPPSIEVLIHETAQSIRGDPTAIDPSTSPFERGDPTTMERPDSVPRAKTPTPMHATGGTIRASAALRRQRGIAGDIRYVFTALFGVRRSRRELAALDHAQQVRVQSRRHHLVTLGRTAVTADAFDHPALGKAGEQLGEIEDERGKHAGAVAAADAELERVRRDREARVKQHKDAMAAIDGELAELAKKQEPLDKEAARAKKRGVELREQLQRITAKIAAVEARRVSVKGPREDSAAIDAEIATLKADRIAVQRDEPEIAAELDALSPRIAAIDAARADARKRRGDADRDETADQRRCAELLEAIGAKRKVVERAAADAEAARDRVLFELGERLCVDRPKILAAQLSPIDQIDLEMGECDRRTMELREILSNVDKAKIARGAAVIAAIALAVGAFAIWLVWMLTRG